MLPTDISNTKSATTMFNSRKASEDISDSKGAGRWTKDEHDRFVQGLKKFGKNWKQIEEYVGTRSGSQVRSHAQKFFLKLEKDGDIDLASLDITNTANDVPQAMRKASAGSNSTNYSQAVTTVTTSNNAAAGNSTSMTVESSESAKKPESLPSPPVVKEKEVLPIMTPKLDNLFSLASLQQRQRRMSIDVFPTKTSSNPLFEAFISKFKQGDSGFQIPKLSEIVDMTSNSRTVFGNHTNKPNIDQLILLNSLSNKVHYSGTPIVVPARKFSEDNILAQTTKSSQHHQHQQYNIPSEFEQISKKLKQV